MTCSMTGYASHQVRQQDTQINVDIKSVNNRYLSVNLKANTNIDFAEEAIRQKISEYLKRGSVSIQFKIKSSLVKKFNGFDENTIQQVISQYENISNQYGFSKVISLDTLKEIPGIFLDQEQDAEEESIKNDLKKLILNCLEDALKNLVQMRRNEGLRLVSVIEDSLNKISTAIESVKAQSQNISDELLKTYLQKINDLIKEVKTDSKLEASDIVKEAAILAEKADISEEIHRVESHLKEFSKVIKNTNAEVGKKLDFLCQELNREFNTICSKTKQFQVTHLAVDGKLEVEKIREQVQNLE